MGKPEVLAEQVSGAQNKTGGPRSAKGKATSARNALKHGFFAGEIVLTKGPYKEDPQEYNALLEELITHCMPEGPIQMRCVEHIAMAIWKDRRRVKVERHYVQDSIEAAREQCERTPEEKENFNTWWIELRDASLHLMRLKLMKDDPKTVGLLREKYWAYVCMYVRDKLGADACQYLNDLKDFDLKKKFMFDQFNMESPQILEAALEACQKRITTLEELMREQWSDDSERSKVASRQAVRALLLADSNEELIARHRVALDREVREKYEELLRWQTIRFKMGNANVRSAEFTECVDERGGEASIPEHSADRRAGKKALPQGPSASTTGEPKLLPGKGSSESK